MASYNSVTTGLAAIQQSFTTGATGPGAQSCYVPMFTRGPYQGADPGSRISIGDVKRFSDGVFANRVYFNLIKAQAAAEALYQAGVMQPNVVVSKGSNSSARPTVLIGMDGNYTGASYGSLGLDKSVPYTPVFSTGLNYMATSTPGTVLATFPSGVSVVSSGGASTAASFAGPAIVAENLNATGGIVQNADSFASELNNSGDVIPGLTLFGVPQYGGDVANVGYSGADVLGQLQGGQSLGSFLSQNTGGNPFAPQPTASQTGLAQFPTGVNPLNTYSPATMSNNAFSISPSYFPSTSAGCTSCQGWM
jgi:hypothetical protein